MKPALNILLGLAAIWVLVSLVAYLLQDRMLFFPQPVSRQNRDELKSYEISFDRDGTVLRGWLYRRAPADDRPFVIYYGGNAEEISWNFGWLRELPVSGFLLMNYRGYGDSEGSPSAAALKSDASSVYDELLEREGLAASQLVLMGRSLGSGVAVDLAAQRPVGGLLLVTPFDRLSSLGAHHYPYLPVRLLLRHRMDSVERAPLVSSSSLCILAENDQVVPPKYGRRLHDALSAPKQLITIAGADHNDIERGDDYWEAIEAFLRAR